MALESAEDGERRRQRGWRPDRTGFCFAGHLERHGGIEERVAIRQLGETALEDELRRHRREIECPDILVQRVLERRGLGEYFNHPKRISDMRCAHHLIGSRGREATRQVRLVHKVNAAAYGVERDVGPAKRPTVGMLIALQRFIRWQRIGKEKPGAGAHRLVHGGRNRDLSEEPLKRLFDIEAVSERRHKVRGLRGVRLNERLPRRREGEVELDTNRGRRPARWKQTWSAHMTPRARDGAAS